MRIRRIISVWLALWMGVSLVAPLLAQSESGSGRLALCCRKGGAHHCPGGMSATPGDGTKIQAEMHCPLCPAATLRGDFGQAGLLIAAVGLREPVVSPALRTGEQVRGGWGVVGLPVGRGPPLAG